MEMHTITNKKFQITSILGIYNSYLLLFVKRKIQIFDFSCE